MPDLASIEAVLLLAQEVARDSASALECNCLDGHCDGTCIHAMATRLEAAVPAYLHPHGEQRWLDLGLAENADTGLYDDDGDPVPFIPPAGAVALRRAAEQMLWDFCRHNLSQAIQWLADAMDVTGGDRDGVDRLHGDHDEEPDKEESEDEPAA
jgi:hypothetical protein